MEPIQINIDYTLADFQEASRALQKHAKRSVRILWGIFAVVFFLAFLASILISLRKPATTNAAPFDAGDFALNMAPYGIAMILMIVAIRWWRSRYVKAIYHRRHPAQRPHQLRIDDQGVELSEPLSRHEFSWDAFLRWQETKNLLLLYVTDAQAYFIPKRSFNDAVLVEKIRECFKSRIDLSSTARQAFPVQSIALSAPLPPPPLPDPSPTPPVT